MNPTCLLPCPGLSSLFSLSCKPAQLRYWGDWKNGGWQGEKTLNQGVARSRLHRDACPPQVCLGCLCERTESPADAWPDPSWRRKVKRGPEGLGRLYSPPGRIFPLAHHTQLSPAVILTLFRGHALRLPGSAPTRETGLEDLTPMETTSSLTKV